MERQIDSDRGEIDRDVESRRWDRTDEVSEEGMANEGTEDAVGLRSMRDDEGTRRERPERRVESALGARYAR